MTTRSRAAILVEPNKPLVVDEVEFADPAPDQALVKPFACCMNRPELHLPAERSGQRLLLTPAFGTIEHCQRV